MKWTRGQLSWLLLLSQGFLTTGQRQTTLGASLQPPASKCSYECVKVYSLHNSNEFDQTNYALDACVKGCDIFSRIEFDRGTHEPLDNLKNCNFSCDDVYEGSLLPACQSGCGFHFDNDVTQPPHQPPAPSFRPRSDAPIPIFTRPMGVSQQPLSSLAPPQRSEAPMIPFRGKNPFFNVFRSQPGPIIVRKSMNLPIQLPMMPRSLPLSDASHRSMNSSPEFPEASEEGPIITKKIPNGPTVIGFSLPQLLSKVNSLIPQLTQGGRPRVMEISINRSPVIEEFHHHQDEMDLPELPRMMEGLFGRKDDNMEPLLREVEELFGDEEDHDNDVEHFMDGSFNNFNDNFNNNFFGRKDDDEEPFSGIFSHFGKMMSSLPQLDSLMPWNNPGNGVGGGKLTVIKAGPGFHEEKSYDIGADGLISEVKPVNMMRDALEHSNPMDSHFNSEDVEVFEVDSNKKTSEPLVFAEPIEEKVEAAPVMDVRGLEEQEPIKEEKVEPHKGSVEEFTVKDLPYLSVLRNNVEEDARDWSEKILARYRSLAEQEYLDNECSSRNLSWSDWVSCLHAKVGVPRWLTAATISLGIIFSLWLCLVIPSTAPKRKVKTLFIKGEKPSSAVIKAAEVAAKAKAKEAEANGFNPGEYMVAVINVDMPPNYLDVTPGSPAPSYKSDMASQVVPGSPAPSYRSVDGEAPKVALEPVHGKKESNA